MTLNDMIEELQDHGFEDTTDTRLTAFLNDAYWDIASREPWPFLEASSSAITTTAGSADITEPTDFGQVISMVIDSNGVNLMPKRADWINKTFSGALTSQGIPSYYYFIGNQIKLYPVPDATYTITLQYLSVPAALEAGSDTPILPARHHRTLVLGALVSAYNMEDDGEQADRFERQYEKRITMMRNDLWTRQLDQPDQMQTGWWDDDASYPFDYDY